MDQLITAPTPQQQSYVQPENIFAPCANQNILQTHDRETSQIQEIHPNAPLNSSETLESYDQGVHSIHGRGLQDLTPTLSIGNSSFDDPDYSNTPYASHGSPQSLTSGLPMTNLYTADDQTRLNNDAPNLYPRIFRNRADLIQSSLPLANTNNIYQYTHFPDPFIPSNTHTTVPVDMTLGTSGTGPILSSSPATLVLHQPRARTRTRRAAKRGRALKSEEESVRVSDGQLFHKKAKETQWRKFNMCGPEVYRFTQD